MTRDRASSPSPDHLIGDSESWSDFWKQLCTVTDHKLQGDAFERLTQLYLRTAPAYRSKLQHVWRLAELPPALRSDLKLPSTDEGIDLIAQTVAGGFWAIQCKFRSNTDRPLKRGDLTTFTGLAFHTCQGFEHALIAHTSSRPIRKLHLMPRTGQIGQETWAELDPATWALIKDRLQGGAALPKPSEPRRHQERAIAAAKSHFVDGGASRGRLIMPCGTGKSLTREYLARGVVPDWLCVCSDESVSDGIETDSFTSAFRQVARTITALSTQDERIVEEFRAVQHGNRSSGQIVEIEGDVPVGMKLDLHAFAGAIRTRVWEWIGRANWRSFGDARAHAQGLCFRSVAEWRDYVRSENRPADIPTDPHLVYRDEGWVSYGDWLGTGSVSTRLRTYRPFHDARDFARSLGLSTKQQWSAYIKAGALPADIPTNPNEVYREAGWAGYGDWFGTGRIATHLRSYRPFSEARHFVRSLGLTSAKAWRYYTKSGALPADVPANPHRVYVLDGWASYGDWLGTDSIATRRRVYQPFLQARTFARSLRLTSQNDWKQLTRSDGFPSDIPSKPAHVYRASGWHSWGDWLGTGRKKRADSAR